MKKPTTSPFERYRQLLNKCVEEFGEMVTLLVDHDMNNAAKKAAMRLVRDTILHGNSARLYVASQNVGLRDELEKTQGTFADNLLKLANVLRANDKDGLRELAAIIAVHCDAILSVVESIEPKLTDGVLGVHFKKHIGYCGGISQADFAKLMGVDKRTVKRWEAESSSPPSVFDDQAKKTVVYSPELRRDKTSAATFVLYYHRHKHNKAGIENASKYIEGETERIEERKRRGIPPSTAPRKADYKGENSEAFARMGWGGGFFNALGERPT